MSLHRGLPLCGRVCDDDLIVVAQSLAEWGRGALAVCSTRPGRFGVVAETMGLRASPYPHASAPRRQRSWRHRVVNAEDWRRPIRRPEAWPKRERQYIAPHSQAVLQRIPPIRDEIVASFPRRDVGARNLRDYQLRSSQPTVRVTLTNRLNRDHATRGLRRHSRRGAMSPRDRSCFDENIIMDSAGADQGCSSADSDACVDADPFRRREFASAPATSLLSEVTWYCAFCPLPTRMSVTS
jgi:hypothetical protein